MVVESVNLPYDWVFGCLETVVVKNTRMCATAQSVARYTGLLPGEERRVARLDMEEMGETLGYSHMVLYTPADSPPSQVLRHCIVLLPVQNCSHFLFLC